MVEDEQRLRSDALAELDAVGGRNFHAPPHEEAGDRTNTVRVAVDRTGAVLDVHIRSDWQRSLTSSELGEALLEAHRNAGLAMTNALALAALAAEERRTAEDDARPAEPRRLHELPDIREIWQTLSTVEDMMYRAATASRDATARHGRTIHSPSGLLTAACEGRTIVRISVEPHLVQQAGAERLRSAAKKLFQAAGHMTGGQS